MFDPRLFLLEFVVHRLALGEVSLRLTGVSLRTDWVVE